MALYAVKLHGKHSCCAYEGNYKVQNRSQLGFALQDVSRNLPGAFLIYIADKTNDRILFANQELIEFAGCKDFDEFLAYTDQRFRNLIHPEEHDAVETSIWKQIDSEKVETMIMSNSVLRKRRNVSAGIRSWKNREEPVLWKCILCVDYGLCSD